MLKRIFVTVLLFLAVNCKPTQKGERENNKLEKRQLFQIFPQNSKFHDVFSGDSPPGLVKKFLGDDPRPIYEYVLTLDGYASYFSLLQDDEDYKEEEEDNILYNDTEIKKDNKETHNFEITFQNISQVFGSTDTENNSTVEEEVLVTEDINDNGIQISKNGGKTETATYVASEESTAESTEDAPFLEEKEVNTSTQENENNPDEFFGSSIAVFQDGPDFVQLYEPPYLPTINDAPLQAPLEEKESTDHNFSEPFYPYTSELKTEITSQNITNSINASGVTLRKVYSNTEEIINRNLFLPNTTEDEKQTISSTETVGQDMGKLFTSPAIEMTRNFVHNIKPSKTPNLSEHQFDTYTVSYREFTPKNVQLHSEPNDTVLNWSYILLDRMVSYFVQKSLLGKNSPED